ncbi:MAG: Ig-like domain-containing protein, partial [Gemmatimonadetes bacterium]|nr:Ig-like domain-containing protein [Gemmatimonadota bacterium]
LEDVASVRVTPENPTLEVGLTLQFEAEALDAAGNVLGGVEFEWTSSRPGVASISPDGVASAITTGTAAITANAGSGKAASQALLVEPSNCDSRVDVILDVGQHQAYDEDTCLFLPTGDIGDRYRVAVIRPTLIEDELDTTHVWLEINPVLTAAQVAGTEPVEPSLVEPPIYSTSPVRFEDSEKLDGTRFLADQRVLQATRRFHRELREREQRLGLRSAPIPVGRRAPDVGPEPAGARSQAGPALVDPPGRDDLFLELDCSVVTPTPVTLIGFNDDLVIYQDSASNAADPVSTAAATQMLSYYASHVADFTDRYWGETPDIDGNERVIVAATPTLSDTVAAAVFSGDFRSTLDCASSNEGEIVYFSEAVMNDLDPDDPEDESFLALGVLAHELKHVTSLYHGVARGSFHNIWIEEGTAEVAQTMSSRIAWAAVGGPAVGSRLTGQNILDWNQSNGEIGPEAWGVVVQLADLIVWGATQPNSLITNPAGAAEFHTFYAGGWHWYRFLGDAFGGASTALADSALFREMTDSLTASGTGSLAAATGRSFNALFEDMIVAAALHDAGPAPALAFTTWDLHSAGAIFANPPEVSPPHRYPWPVTTNVPGGTAQANPSRSFSRGTYSCPPKLVGLGYQPPDEGELCPMGPSGIRFHDFVSGGEGLGAQVQVYGARNGQIVVVRLN